MTLAQGGMLPSVPQSPVEAPTWPSSSLLNKRGEDEEEEEEEADKRVRAGREKTEEGDGERRRCREIEETEKEEGSGEEMTVTWLCGAAGAT